jgi:hypothetical protein
VLENQDGSIKKEEFDLGFFNGLVWENGILTD